MMGNEPDWAKDCYDEAELKRRILKTRSEQGEKPTPATIQKIYRSLIASREISQTLKVLKENGCTAIYISVDITDAEALSAKLTPAIKELGGVITGIIHGAGNLADKRIEKKTEQDFDRVYGAKINGLNNLLSCVSINQLEYLVLFSSVAGFYGNAGQADYALANEILNKTALWIKQHYPACHAVAINWGPWESGMVTPALKAAFEQRGITVLPVEAATQMLVNELGGRNQDTAQVIIGDPIPASLTGLNGGLKTHRLHRKLTLSGNPFLTDHVIAGVPVLPFTCAMAWMSRATEQLYPQYCASCCEEVKLLKGIRFNRELANDYVLELTELSKSEDRIVIASKIYSKDSKGRTRYHFSGRNLLRRQHQPRPTLSSVALESSSTPELFGRSQLANQTEDKDSLAVRRLTASDFYDTSTYNLFHGSSFQGLERILEMTPERVVAQSLARRLTSEQQGQFPIKTIDPYTADILMHPILIWLEHFYQSMCLPAFVSRYQVFENPPYNKPFYTSIEIVSKTRTSLTANFISYDDAGKVYTLTQGGRSTIFPTNVPTDVKAA